MAVRQRMFYRGLFKPKNPKKYRGNVRNIVYRSQWECQYMHLLDTNESVVSWVSEEIVIKYYNPIKLRWARYFPDFLIEMKDKDGKIVKALVEIKPFHEIAPPRQNGKKMQTYLYETMTYAVNQAKWRSAKKWCDEHKVKFYVVTKDNKDRFQLLNEDNLQL